MNPTPLSNTHRRLTVRGHASERRAPKAEGPRHTCESMLDGTTLTDFQTHMCLFASDVFLDKLGWLRGCQLHF